jgi:hypothetical protein
MNPYGYKRGYRPLKGSREDNAEDSERRTNDGHQGPSYLPRKLHCRLAGRTLSSCARQLLITR